MYTPYIKFNSITNCSTAEINVMCNKFAFMFITLISMDNFLIINSNQNVFAIKSCRGYSIPTFQKVSI